MTGDTYLAQFDPIRAPHTDLVIESATNYAARMRSTVLPTWPEEVLVEWLHRHARCIDRYAFIGFERLCFQRQVWSVDRFPSQDSFRLESGFAETAKSVRVRAAGIPGWPGSGHFPAKYLLEHGTWNTPVVMFDNTEHRLVHPDGWALTTPYHLLEGHSRLAYLLALRADGLANPEHEVWLADLRVSPS